MQLASKNTIRSQCIMNYSVHNGFKVLLTISFEFYGDEMSRIFHKLFSFKFICKMRSKKNLVKSNFMATKCPEFFAKYSVSNLYVTREVKIL